MRPNESGTTRVSMSRTIASLNDLRIFVTRSSADSITFDTIRKRSKPCFIPFFKMDVELFMRTYIAAATKCCSAKSRVRGTIAEADPVPPFRGRPMTLGKNQANALSGTAGVGAQASEERFAE